MKLFKNLRKSLLYSYVANKFESFYSTHNLQSILQNMPKPSKHTAALQKHRQKLKEKALKYQCANVTLQVLGSGANGAPRSLYVLTDQSRYMFNCGEGTQRLAHEHKMKLAKLEHIFVTYGSWENIGGLPGVSLTIQDVGVPEITIHGPEGIVDIFSATRRFIILKDLSVKMADYKEQSYFEDNVMRVNYVPLKVGSGFVSRRTAVSLDRTGKRDESSDGASSSTDDGIITSDDETDYYAHERGSVLADLPNIKKRKKKKNKRSASVSKGAVCDSKRRCIESGDNVAMSYICKLHPRPGALNLEACVERGVPPGPLLGRLKSGEDIELEDGRVIKSSDVTLPDDPGPVFIVVECPNEKFLEPLEKEVMFTHHQLTATTPDQIAYLVVHFTPPNILHNSRYKHWMEKFPPSTQHLIINEDNSCMGSVAVHRIQYKLNLLHPEIFPLLSDSGIPTVTLPSETSNGNVLSEDSNNKESECSMKANKGSDCSVSLSSSSSVCSFKDPDTPVYQGRTCSIIQLRPQKPLDSSNELILNPAEYSKEVFQEEEMLEALKELTDSLNSAEFSVNDKQHPNIIFLGTGSCIPNKTRNTSGILLNISEKCCMLMDCGEGTYGQLVRFYGKDNVGDILSSMRAIYISHLHADHHIGLIGILKARRKYTNNSSNSPLFLLAPKQIMTWLRYYNDNFEPVLQQVEIVPNGELVYNNVTLEKNLMNRLCNTLDMSSVLTAGVKHCPNSFGVSVKHNSGWKITYSGDTMPCDSLVELGKDSTLLIHEATMEDELVREACLKMHSTTSGAIEIGNKMKAKFTILTHFSQRYATLPRFNENFKEGVGIAFDNMRVRLTDLPKLPLMYRSLKLMFSAHQDELEQKAYRRQMKELKMANSRSKSQSPTPK
ncbi:ribonuclease Z [Lycorma delicatula]|uniref:ribonuclease Z n=1 Tax=Lycorma delicatula TaxID=130591 RepID=UPI003F50F9E2